MKFYEIPWGVYPRRVDVYLAEKGITNIERIAIDPTEYSTTPILGKLTPAGSAPALDTGEGTVLGSSLAILEYLEEKFPTPNMLGTTPEIRAMTREFTFVIDEATTYFGIWTLNASPIFDGRLPQSREAAKTASIAYNRKLKLLDKMTGLTEGEFLTGDEVTIADCVTYSILQFAKDLYSVPIPDDCSHLQQYFDMFSRRKSAEPRPFPQEILSLGKGLPDQIKDV